MAVVTTLCYIEQDGKYLMLYRNKKENDINKGKWIGIGGHVEGAESPEECLIREAKEETGLTLSSYYFRGLITFVPEPGRAEYMCLYTADGYEGELKECDEGELKWVSKNAVDKLNLWEGDRLFLELLRYDIPFFSLKLEYDGDQLCAASLDGRALFDRRQMPETGINGKEVWKGREDQKDKGWRLPWAK
ncbi:8-oxo-dGTP diphosphatase [Lachnospiraceae bacterium 62-35]